MFDACVEVWLSFHLHIVVYLFVVVIIIAFLLGEEVEEVCAEARLELQRLRLQAAPVAPYIGTSYQT